MLRTLTELRTRGWGVSLDDVGADSRSLAVMPLLYPDVIKLDLRLLAERDPVDVARVVTAVGAEAERRHATVLAEGIDSDAQLEMARAAGATLGQGFMLGEPGPLPDPLPKPGRPLRLAGAGGDASGPLPYQRVTNWKRPTRGPLELAERAAALLSGQAAALGPTGMLLAAPDSSHSSERYEALRDALGFVGVLEPGVLEDTWTEVALGPGYGACFVARRDGDEWLLRDLLRPRAGRRVRAAAHGAAAAASATSAMTFETCAPCQASGEAPSSSVTSRAPRDRLGVALADRVRVLGVDLVAAGDDDRRRVDRARGRSQSSNGRERGTACSASASASGCSCAESRWCRTRSIVSCHFSGTFGVP